MQPRDYLRPLLQRWWLIVLVVGAVTAGTYLYYDHQPREYASSTQIFVDADQGAAVAGDSLEPVTDRTTQNQATLLTSQDVEQRVARDLEVPVSELGSIEAAPTAGSDFITVTARDDSAEKAARLADAYAAAFIALRSSEQRDLLQDALDNQLEQLESVPPGPRASTDRVELQATVRRLRLALSLPTGAAQQVDPAPVPDQPDSPRPRRNAAFAFVLSLIVALGLAYGLERFDRRLKRLEDLEAVFGLPILAAVPHSRNVQGAVDGASCLGEDLREVFRQLHTNLELEGMSRPMKRILVTSAVPGEGKSVVARNLAIAFCESGERVAVVDCDLRRSNVHSLFGREGRPGLTSVMTGETTLEGAMVKVPIHARGLASLVKMRPAGPSSADSEHEDVAALSLLPAGPAPANPQAILATERMTDLLEQIGAEHDVVIIDSPPVAVVSDALTLAGEVDAIVLVARLGLTTRDAAGRALELLHRVPGGGEPVGIVANATRGSMAPQYAYSYD